MVVLYTMKTTECWISFLKTVCQMSQDDLKNFGTSIGLGTTLDNFQSLKFNPYTNQNGGGAFAYLGAAAGGITAGLICGNGLSNNMPFAFTQEMKHNLTQIIYTELIIMVIIHD